LGETVKAVIVLREGQTAAPAEIVGWCREHLASYKRPRFIEFVTSEQVPRSTTGKILRHELAKWPVSEEQRV
jgi:acyl-CoA synthetase (AMP-forming)/AMP-acid ligase II